MSQPPQQVSTPPRILVNQAQCKTCGDIITSHHVHDFVSCSCGAIAVDGGRDYLRRCGNLDAYIELSTCVPLSKGESPCLDPPRV